MFFRGSRYEAVAVAIHVDSQGHEIPYVRLRRLPARASVQRQHPVVLGERLDHIAFQYFGDPEQFWRIADANETLQPEALTRVAGGRLAIPLL